jgi:hypothetical protein
LLAAPAVLLLSQGQAKAVLTYNIFESAGNVVVETNGSIDLTGAVPFLQGSCGINGLTVSSAAIICTGGTATMQNYRVSGPSAFNGNVTAAPASSVSGISTMIRGAGLPIFAIDPAYASNTAIIMNATFNGQTLASLGFTTTGLIGTWTLDGTSETIQVVLGPPSPAVVSGPLPLVGAAAAFGFSRRLRKRIAAPLSTPPQA